MAISKIILKGVASYDDKGIELSDLKKLNFFFGYNGSGKSTIARYLYNISLASSAQSEDFNSCTQEGYKDTDHSIVVFDENFKRENFFEQDSLKGIFSLNRTNDIVDAKIKKYDLKLKEIKNSETSREKRYREILKKQRDKHDHIVKQCFELRRQFDAFQKEKLPYGGSKERHFNEILVFLASEKPPKTFSAINDEYKRLYDTEIQNISINIDEHEWKRLLAIETELTALLHKIIVGNNDIDIATLINELNISSWVELGVEHLEKSGNKCPFCQQSINDLDVLKKKFALFFDRQFKEDTQKIRELGNQFFTSVAQLKNVLREISKSPALNIDSQAVLDNLTVLSENTIQLIREKLEKPNEVKELESICNISTDLINLKEKVEKNNRDFLDIGKLKESWVKDCWIYMAHNKKSDIERYLYFNKEHESVLALNAQLKEKNEKQTVFVQSQIEFLRKQTVNTTEAVDNINKILKNVGFYDFHIEEQKKEDGISKYYLKRRNGTNTKVFKSLSEGEKTFISFLYFYQLCIGSVDIENDGAKKKIIVIDDPVSSLDSQILFIVTTLIHKLAQRRGHNKNDKKEFLNPNIEQILILTHNFYFYKEVSLNRRPFCTDYHHYKIYKENYFTRISTSPTSQITDDYSLMWSTLKETKAKGGSDKSINLMLANLMRRIIDTYIDFIGMKKSGSTITWSALDGLDINTPEYIIGAAFISSINSESHSVSPLDDEYYSKIIREDTTVLFSSFRSIFKHIGKEHYEMMMDESIEE